MGLSAPSDWPPEGKISIRDLSVGYVEDAPAVLRDVNLEIAVSPASTDTDNRQVNASV